MLCMRNVLMNILHFEVILAPLPTEINSHQGLNCFQIAPLALNNADKVLAEGGSDALSRLVKPLAWLLKWLPRKTSKYFEQWTQPIRQLQSCYFFHFDEEKSDNLAHQVECFPNLFIFFECINGSSKHILWGSILELAGKSWKMTKLKCMAFTKSKN